MSNESFFSRRTWIAASGLIGLAQLLGLKPSLAANISAKTPALTAEEIAAIEAAMGKKETYNEGQSVHTTPLPRNDLKVTVKGEPARSLLALAAKLPLKEHSMVNLLS